MPWRRLPLCFELLSPLHIGFLPNGAGTVVARTRCYVPGKTVWGALTATLTPVLHPHPSPDDFRRVGEELQRHITLSYFFLSDGQQLFAPDYTDDGLVWGPGKLRDQDFRAQFIGARVATAIGPTGGAYDASLHEIEFLRQRIGSPGAPTRATLLAGMLWLGPDAEIDALPLTGREHTLWLGDRDALAELVIGGERNYGFGRLHAVPVPQSVLQAIEATWPGNPGEDLALDHRRPLPGHVPYRGDQPFRGDVEIVAGREYPSAAAGAAFSGAGLEITGLGHCFAPGTHLLAAAAPVHMDPWGRLLWSGVRPPAAC